MSKKFYLVMSLLVVASMVLAACGGGGTAPASGAKAFKACQVTDVGGIDDKSFNATAWKGMEDAAAAFDVEVKYLESQNQSDYEVNLNAFIDDGCDVIVSIGFLLADATAESAANNPDQKYGIVDVDWLSIPNLRGNAAKIDQATFRTLGALRTFGTLGTLGPFRPLWALRSAFSRRALRTRVTLRTRVALRTRRTGRPDGAWLALRTRLTLRTLRTGGAHG
ncbi:MAG: BMP family ABC transporter substrate-binding protein, partial [Anaerolineales bacterium]